MKLAFSDDSGSGRPLLLLQGLGFSRGFWDRDFAAQLSAAGFRVLPVDLRDVGESEFHAKLPPNVGAVMQAALGGPKVAIPYTIADMADDVAELITGLALHEPIVLGVSLGGLVTQSLAIRHGALLGGIVVCMTSVGDPKHLLSSVAAHHVFDPPPEVRSDYIEHLASTMRALSPLDFSEARVRQRAADAFGTASCRTYSERLRGASRQLAALLQCGSLAPQLSNIGIPASVIHGDADPLVPLEAGFEIAEAIAHASWLPLEGMGHDLTQPYWEEIIAAILELTPPSCISL